MQTGLPERLLAVTILMAAALTVAGCCPLIPSGSSEVWVREEQDGKEISVRVGQTIVVDLEAAPTTGYRWEIEGLDGAILRQVGEPEFESKAPFVMGAPAQQRLRLEVVGAGSTTLSLVYRRSRETGKPPAKTYTVTVASR